MGIDSLQTRSESIPMGTHSRKYKFAATPVRVKSDSSAQYFNRFLVRKIYFMK